MRTLCFLVVAALALAGCGDDGDDEPTPTPTATPTGTSPTPTGPGPGVVNAAPIADLKADTEGGAAPLVVNFTIDGKDLDGDAVTWTLDADGDGEGDLEGTSVPANRSFTYESAGTYNATLNVTDGIDSTEDTITVTVTAPPAPEEPEGAFTPIDESVSVVGICTHCTEVGVAGCPNWTAGLNGAGICAWVELPPEAAGHDYTVTSDGIPSPDPDAAFMSSCDAATATEVQAVGATGDEVGKVPAGSGCLVGWEFAELATAIQFIVE